MSNNYSDIEYLKSGSQIQQAGYAAIKEVGILNVLGNYHATLVGTLPLDIFTSSSDLDIICTTHDFNLFAKEVISHFGEYPNFDIHEKTIKNIKSIVAHFQAEGFRFEIFAQPIPVKEQAAYLHMIVEEKILRVKGNEFREQILTLKKSGIKTEPAFAMLLNLKGDPYDALLHYSC